MVPGHRRRIRAHRRRCPRARSAKCQVGSARFCSLPQGAREQSRNRDPMLSHPPTGAENGRPRIISPPRREQCGRSFRRERGTRAVSRPGNQLGLCTKAPPSHASRVGRHVGRVDAPLGLGTVGRAVVPSAHRRRSARQLREECHPHRCLLTWAHTGPNRI